MMQSMQSNELISIGKAKSELPSVAISFIIIALKGKSMGTISVSGSGTVTQEPDVANITFRVETIGKKASESIAANATIMNALLEIVKKYGIEKRHTRTVDFSNNPTYAPQAVPRKGQKPKTPVLTGYQAEHQMQVRLADVSTLGQVLNDLTAGGASSLDVQFDIGDKSLLEKQARDLAYKDARSRVEQFASLDSVKIVALLSLDESSRWSRSDNPRFGKAALTRSVVMESVPVEGGEQSITANVKATWKVVTGDGSHDDDAFRFARNH